VGRMIQGLIPGGSMSFFLLNPQSGCEGHPASHSVGIGGSFLCGEVVTV